jgi:DNA-binding LytR/AlgR family response regulator
MRLSIRRENLLFVESGDNEVCVWCVNNNQPKKVMVRNTLKHIVEQLESTHARRCHRSYVVNLDLVKVLRREKEGIFVELGIDGVPDIPISKTYIENVQNLLMSGPDVA